METITPLSSAALSPTEVEQLRPAIAARYPDAKGILGSQLGAFVRRHLTNPDLKGRFGGLKNFVAHYFPSEIVWRGRRGLDDLYDISFSEASNRGIGAWQPVSSEPFAGLWSAVTNPSIYVQFAWSATDQRLLQSSAGVPPTEGLVGVEKLTKADYQNIAAAFVNSVESALELVFPLFFDATKPLHCAIEPLVVLDQFTWIVFGRSAKNPTEVPGRQWAQFPIRAD